MSQRTQAHQSLTTIFNIFGTQQLPLFFDFKLYRRQTLFGCVVLRHASANHQRARHKNNRQQYE